jgi:hypothetical protein
MFALQVSHATYTFTEKEDQTIQQACRVIIEGETGETIIFSRGRQSEPRDRSRDISKDSRLGFCYDVLV